MKRIFLLLISVCLLLTSCAVNTKETTENTDVQNAVTVSEPDTTSLDDYKKPEPEIQEQQSKPEIPESPEIPETTAENGNTVTQTYPQETTEKPSSTPNNAYTKPVEQKPLFDGVYFANTNTKKFHKSTCGSAKLIKDTNLYKTTSRDELINEGFVPCARCNP